MRKDLRIKKPVVVDGTLILPKERGKRFKWLAKVVNDNVFTIGAEIGSHSGMTTSYLLQNCKQLKKLYAVDLWEVPPKECSDQYGDWNFKQSRASFNNRTNGFKALQVLQGISWDVVNEVEDNTLDFIFIDADHKYESVVKDIRAWTPKLKQGGMISGHDTHFPGVQKAISELTPTWKAAGVDHCWYARKEDVIL